MSDSVSFDTAWSLSELSNHAAEAAILGAILFENTSFDRLSPWLKPEHFSDETFRTIFQIMCDRIPLGKVVDGVTTVQAFKERGLLTEQSDLSFLSDLLDRAAFGPEIIDYGQIIVDLAIKRGILAATEEVKKSAVTKSGPELIDELNSRLIDLTPTSQSGDWVDSRIAVSEMVVDCIEGKTAAKLKYGIPVLDKRTGGLFPGDLIVLAGRPSIGKTAAANWIGYKAAEAAPDSVVGVFNLEMSNQQNAMRFASLQYRMQTGEDLPYQQFRQGNINREQTRQIAATLENCAPVYWRACPGATYVQIKQMARQLKRKRGRLDLVIIDYLQLMRPPGKRQGNRVSEISETTMELKAMAQELEVPVILLSQLSRQVEQRDNKRPFLSDLRDSGSIEQDADTIHFCYREHYYLSRQEAPKDNKNGAADAFEAALIDSEPKFEFLTPKLRMGAQGDDVTYWDAAHGVFYETRSEAVGFNKTQGAFQI